MFRNGDRELRLTAEEHISIQPVLDDRIGMEIAPWPSSYVVLHGDRVELDVVVSLLKESGFSERPS